MSESRRFLFKLLSLLLQYPDTGLKSAFSDLEELSSKLSERSAELICRRFLPYLQTTPLLRAQEYYTQTFDLSPESCLYLTWHRWREGEERGRDLARLLRIYRQAGYECVSKDLPDYLPLVLEFASVCPGDSGFGLLSKFSPEIEKLRVRLQESGSPYAGLLALLAEAVTEPQQEDRRRDDELG